MVFIHSKRCGYRRHGPAKILPIIIGLFVFGLSVLLFNSDFHRFQIPSNFIVSSIFFIIVIIAIITIISAAINYNVKGNKSKPFNYHQNQSQMQSNQINPYIQQSTAQQEPFFQSYQQHETPIVHQTSTFYCSYCGEKMASDAVFCPQCGNKLK